MTPPRDYDSTVARIAGNILSGHLTAAMELTEHDLGVLARSAVRLARAIVEETRRTEPKEPKA